LSQGLTIAAVGNEGTEGGGLSSLRGSPPTQNALKIVDEKEIN